MHRGGEQWIEGKSFLPAARGKYPLERKDK